MNPFRARYIVVLKVGFVFLVSKIIFGSINLIEINVRYWGFEILVFCSL